MEKKEKRVCTELYYMVPKNIEMFFSLNLKLNKGLDP